MTNSFNKPFLLIIILISFLACNADNKKVNRAEESSTFVENSLIKHTVLSGGHPMAVWEKKADNAKGAILLVHGRTYSSIPDFDLQVEGEELSLMDGMVAQGYSAYALDLRGYGGTPRDSTEWLSLEKAGKDILNVLHWVSEENDNRKVHLFGWSMGASTTLFATQQNATKIASLTLFGFGQDLDFKYPEGSTDKKLQKKVNTAVHAASDFISPGNISQKAIDTYVKVALEHDPIKVDWRFGNQFNNIDPSLITIPVLVLQGALDPIVTAEKQTKLFTRLKTADKSWVVFSGGGHAAHLETSRKHFIHSFTSFIDRFNE